MTTYTLTGQITDFGDVAATNVTGTVEAGGLVDGSWVPLSRYVGPDYLTHVGATEVKVAADRSLVRSDTGGPIVLEASNDLFSYRLTLRIARGRAHVYYFTLSRDLDVRELDLAVPDPALDAVAPPHDLYIPASGTTPQPVAGAVTWDTSMRDVQAEISLTADTTITLTGDRLGAMVYIIPTLNTHILTVGDFIVSDRAAFHRELGGWVMLAGGSVITPDVTPPTAGTLAGSAITSDGFTLTVTGAADETALAALPYRFSTDNGTTWSAWRSTPYVATGLTPSTAYTCQHQTRDAAGNVTNGQPVEGTTLALTITDPTALGSCLAYFDASDAAKLTVNGGDVTSWAASGGTHSWTYTQDGAGTLPTVAQVNGKNAVALSADGARLMARVGGTVAPHFDIGGAKTAPFTVWQILKVTATGGGGVVAQWTPGIQAQMQATVGTIFGLGGHIVSAAVYQLGEVFLLALTSNATPNSKLYRGSQMVGQVNNAAGATLFGEAANTVNYTYVGANGQTLRATLCEFGFHMKELTVADLTELQNYATAKWGAA